MTISGDRPGGREIRSPFSGRSRYQTMMQYKGYMGKVAVDDVAAKK
jgi:hypothetical protein